MEEVARAVATAGLDSSQLCGVRLLQLDGTVAQSTELGYQSLQLARRELRGLRGHCGDTWKSGGGVPGPRSRDYTSRILQSCDRSRSEIQVLQPVLGCLAALLLSGQEAGGTIEAPRSVCAAGYGRPIPCPWQVAVGFDAFASPHGTEFGFITRSGLSRFAWRMFIMRLSLEELASPGPDTEGSSRHFMETGYAYRCRRESCQAGR